MYQVGLFLDPAPDDASYEDEGAAIGAAREMAGKAGYNAAIAVWDCDEVIHLFLGDEQFRPA